MITDVLIVAAHPDDEVLGCGGTITRLAKEGKDVVIAILGEGITSRHPDRQSTETLKIQKLHECCHKAAKMLGAKDVYLYNLPDNRFDTVPLLDIVKIVEELITRLQPSVIYTHHSGDLNIDHSLTHRAVLTAVRPMAECLVKELFAFEGASSTEWAFQQFEPVFKPNVFMDIADTIEIKIQAMACYESEVRLFPHPRSPENLRGIAKRWGVVSCLEFSEAFELIRSIR